MQFEKVENPCEILKQYLQIISQNTNPVSLRSTIDYIQMTSICPVMAEKEVRQDEDGIFALNTSHFPHRFPTIVIAAQSLFLLAELRLPQNPLAQAYCSNVWLNCCVLKL